MLALLILCCIRFPDIKIFSGTRSLTNLLYADIIHPPIFNNIRALLYRKTIFSSRTHLTYQFLIHVLLHVERNSALSLRPYHIEFDTHLESLLFHIFFFRHPVRKCNTWMSLKNNAVRTAKDGVLCKAEYVSKIIVITPIIFFMYYSLKSANTIILKCVSTFSLSRINELIISEEWTKSSLRFIPL